MHLADADGDLVGRAVAGDSVALKVLLTESYLHLREYLARKIPPDLMRVSEADDILQEAHVEVFRRIGSFVPRGPHSFERWVTAVAVSRLRNAIKRHRAIKRGGGRMLLDRPPPNFEDSTVALLDLLAGPSRTASRSIARREAVEAVQGALAELPEHYRSAIWLVHIEGKSARDAAMHMNRTERAIHGLCRRGLKLLEARLIGTSTLLSSCR